MHIQNIHNRKIFDWIILQNNENRSFAVERPLLIGQSLLSGSKLVSQEQALSQGCGVRRSPKFAKRSIFATKWAKNGVL